MRISVTDRPIDRLTARVTRRGVSFDGNYAPSEPLSETPLPTITFDGPPDADLTGKQFGRFRVLGYAGRASCVGARWSVRCTCGRYTYRTTKALKRASVPPDQRPPSATFGCQRCQYDKHLKNVDHKRRHGIWPDEVSK